jgi:uncharacterized protein YeaO (DUF488 family)
MAIEIKRIHEPASASDGFRVLVDRIWPRGISKDRARIDLWLKDVAPSTELRRWFDHQAERWAEFRARYFRELGENREALAPLVARAKRGRVTLLYAAKEERFNNAVALREYLRGRPSRGAMGARRRSSADE